FFGPVEHEFFGRNVGRRRPANKPEGPQEAIHDPVGLSAGENFCAGRGVATVDRGDVCYAIALKAVADIGFVQVATNAGKITLQRSDRLASWKGWSIEL